MELIKGHPLGQVAKGRGSVGDLKLVHCTPNMRRGTDRIVPMEIKNMARIPVNTLNTAESEASLRAADVIMVKDRGTGFSEWLYGQDAVPQPVALGAPAYEIRSVEIEIDSKDPQQLEQARTIVARCKPKPR